MTCSQHGCGQTGTTYRLAMRKTVSVLCDAHRASLMALGMVWVPERRSDDLTPIVERRKPEWLSRLTGRDETGRLVA